MLHSELEFISAVSCFTRAACLSSTVYRTQDGDLKIRTALLKSDKKKIKMSVPLDPDALKKCYSLAGSDQSSQELANLVGNFAEETNSYELKSKLVTGKPAPREDPFALRSEWRVRYIQRQERLNKSRALSRRKLNLSFANISYVSTTAFSSLKRTSIFQLKVNVRAQGFYLLLRTLELPMEIVGIFTIVEDHMGNVIHFATYNMTDSDFVIPPEEVFPLGVIFILKEPFLMLSLEGRCVIRCDSPTDIIMVQKHHKFYELVQSITWRNPILDQGLESEPRTAAEWKELGNRYFERKLYSKATEAYFMALKLIEKGEVDLKKIAYLNIAATYLKRGYYESTIIHACKVLDIDPKNEKALYRAGYAHYELRNYEDATQYFNNLLCMNPKCTEGEIMSKKCGERQNEEKGNFDFHKLFLTSKLKPKSSIECADYEGPLKVVEVPEKGRGYVATRDIEPGTLLIVSKAFKVAFDDDSEFTLQKHSSDGSCDFGNNARLVTKVAQSIIKNPLTHGKHILDLKSYAGSLEETGKLFCDEIKKEEVIVDIERIRGTLNTNGFAAISTYDGKIQGGCLHIKPSYFNHSCVSNANWCTYNDVIVVFSVKHINCEEEIYISYFSVFDSYSRRKNILNKRMFQCACLVCALERAENDRQKEERDAIYEEFVKATPEPESVSSHKVKKMRMDIKRLERTFKNSGTASLTVTLLEPSMKLAFALFMNVLLIDAMEVLDKGLRSIGLDCKKLLQFADGIVSFPQNSIVTPILCDITIWLIIVYDHVGQTEEAKRWLRVLVNLEKLFFGRNVNFVRFYYKDIPSHLF